VLTTAFSRGPSKRRGTNVAPRPGSSDGLLCRVTTCGPRSSSRFHERSRRRRSDRRGPDDPRLRCREAPGCRRRATVVRRRARRRSGLCRSRGVCAPQRTLRGGGAPRAPGRRLPDSRTHAGRSGADTARPARTARRRGGDERVVGADLRAPSSDRHGDVPHPPRGGAVQQLRFVEGRARARSSVPAAGGDAARRGGVAVQGWDLGAPRRANSARSPARRSTGVSG